MPVSLVLDWHKSFHYRAVRFAEAVDAQGFHGYDKNHMQSSPKSRFRGLWSGLRRELRWLKPGIGVKRWLVLILAGTTLLGVGFAILLLDVYRSSPGTWWLPILSALALRALDRTLRAVVFGGIGVALVLLGTWGLNRTLLAPFMPAGKNILDSVTAFRKRDRGPRIVTLGGGNGLASLLRGLKAHTHNLTAIVTVADDGGSSGELRKNIGILPPGDIRNCLAALSSDEDLLTQIFQYRFPSSAGLNGHSLGNLLITALTDITGSFEEAVFESGRVLGVQGRVVPSTLHDVRLMADVVNDAGADIKVSGESAIPRMRGQVRRVWLEPDNPNAFPPAIQAILTADLILIGPGSVYTSIMPNLLVPDIAAAVRASRAIKFFICNVATQPGETDDYSCRDHMKAIEKHLGLHMFDLVVCNKDYSGKLAEDSKWVMADEKLAEDYPLYSADLADRENSWRHDSVKLANVVMDLFYERTGPLLLRH
jgi:uncharacterized cofD-like protein